MKAIIASTPGKGDKPYVSYGTACTGRRTGQHELESGYYPTYAAYVRPAFIERDNMGALHIGLVGRCQYCGKDFVAAVVHGAEVPT